MGEARSEARAISPAEATKRSCALCAPAVRGMPADPGDHEDVHAYVEAAIAAQGGPGGGQAPHRPVAQRPGGDGSPPLAARGLPRSAGRGRRAGGSARPPRRREAATAMPGYTHGKRAEPVTFGHWCLAYVEMLLRDAARLREAAARADECPLGSGALSGSPIAVDRAALARAISVSLGPRPTRSMPSRTGMRPRTISTGGAPAVASSRLAEDLIFYSSDEAGFVEPLMPLLDRFLAPALTRRTRTSWSSCAATPGGRSGSWPDSWRC